jgi:hypothetical protein
MVECVPIAFRHPARLQLIPDTRHDKIIGIEKAF